MNDGRVSARAKALLIALAIVCGTALVVVIVGAIQHAADETRVQQEACTSNGGIWTEAGCAWSRGAR